MGFVELANEPAMTALPPLPVAIDPKCKDIYSEGMLDLKVFLTSHYSSLIELR